MFRATMVIVLMSAVSPAAVSHQATVPADGVQTFEVASVKRNVSGASNMSMGGTPGRYAATNVPLRQLIAAAYRVPANRVTGGPDWMNAERFDVVARAPQGAAPASIFPMLRELLRERFKLVARLEARDQPVYALVQLRPDRPARPNLKRTTLECQPTEIPANPCRMNGTIGSASGSVKATGQTMVDFAAYLTNNVDRPVVDQTELPGRFDFELTWTADDARGMAIDPLSDNSRPVLVTALQERLGLKLESARGLVQFLIIDSVERPISDEERPFEARE